MVLCMMSVRLSSIAFNRAADVSSNFAIVAPA
jgi:hypothetical protein